MADVSIFDQYEDPYLKAKMINLFDSFRTTIKDYDAGHNILNGKQLEFSDPEVLRYLDRGLQDINKGSPPSNYKYMDFPDMNLGLLIDAAFVWSLVGLGILQLRNNIEYSDSGLSVNMFNKSPQYQGWLGTFLQLYIMDKKEFKKSILVNASNAGFFGLGSEFGYGQW